MEKDKNAKWSKWMFTVNARSVVIILLGTLINILGSRLAAVVSIPFRLDCIGTFLSAVLLGPVAGAVSGFLMNVVLNFWVKDLLWFGIVSIIGGVVVGRMIPRDRKPDSFFTIGMALVAGVAMIAVSVPINMIFRNGYTGNEWGDALVVLLQPYITVDVLRCFLGCVLVDMPDKALSISIVMVIIYIVRAYQEKKHKGNPGEETDQQIEKKAGAASGMMVLLVLSVAGMAVFGFSSMAVADPVNEGDEFGFEDNFMSTIYGKDDGLVSVEINTIAQTKDGYVWAGAYSGLYRYNGMQFEQMEIDDRISNVIVLFEDSKGQLWIGTNDSGVFCYDSATKKVTGYTVSDGLSTNSIRSICEDEDGRIYVGTTDHVCRIEKDGSIFEYAKFSEISCVYSLKYIGDGQILGVTQNGLLFVLKGQELVLAKENENSEEIYTAAAYGDQGFLLGNSKGTLEYYSYSSGKLHFENTVEMDSFSDVNYILYDEDLHGFFVAAMGGLGFYDVNGNLNVLTRDGFNAAVTDVMVDYQGNIWFASTKQGILKLSENPFTDVFAKAGLEDAAVNAILRRGDVLFVGLDTGLLALDADTYVPVENDITAQFEGMRIRNLMEDEKGNVWVSIYGGSGLATIRFAGEKGLVGFCDSDDVLSGQLLGKRFRFTLALKNGDILAFSTDGLNVLGDGRVKETVGVDDGLTTQILTAVEKEDGTILAGSDGDGIYVVQDGTVKEHIGEEEGLNALVVLRIVPCSGGYLYVTSKGIYYHENGKKVRRLTHFPYNNNYDIYIAEDGKAWVSSSAGIYVVSIKDMLADEKDYSYDLLNQVWGFDTTLTANAWNAFVDDELFVCCTDGVRSVNVFNYSKMDDGYKIVIDSFVNGKKEVPLVDGVYVVPSGTGNIRIAPAVLNFTASNPLVRYFVKGEEDASITVHQDEMTDLVLPTLSYGKYSVYVQVLDATNGTVLKEKNFAVRKDAQLYDRWYYKVYLVLVGVMLVAFFAWMGAKMSSMALINRQYDQIREAKEEAEYANQAKSRFLAQMSHEIRTPINAVLGMDEMILRESGEPEIRAYAADIGTAANTLLSLINEILDSSKIESGKMEIVPVEYELSVLVRDLVNMISQRAQAKDLVFELEADENLPSKLFGDDVRIRQVITNILTNAVKYTPSGTVWFRVNGMRDGEDILLHVEVEDTGIGIKEEDLPKLFEAYQRIEEGRNRNIEGTGLGMNITIQLLKLMDSSLKVESVYGKGTKFYFDIRQKVVDESPVGDMTVSRGAEESYSYEGGFIAPDAKVLVVDDNAMNRKVFRSLLKVTQVQVTEAGGGVEALEIVGDERFDLIFTDHMMPDMDGVETMQHMRELENCDGVPIYVLTANAVTGAKEQYLEAGFDGFLSKPIISEKLEEVLRTELPADKLLPYDESMAAMGGSSGLSASSSAALLEDLPVIDGVDWNYAWMHLPEEELLAQTVRDFYDVLVPQAEKLDRMYAQLVADGMMDEYRIQVHGMKSAAATIGIVPLAGMAKILEYAARDGQKDIIDSMHQVFIDEWKSYGTKLVGVFGIGEGQQDDVDKEYADAGMLEALFGMIRGALEDFDMDAVDELAGQLKSYAYAPDMEGEIASLIMAMKDMDEDAANEIMDRISEMNG